MLEGETRSQARWYVNATNVPLNWYQRIGAKTGISSTQLRRFRLLATGRTISRHEFGLSMNTTTRAITALRKSVPWCPIILRRGSGYSVPSAYLPRLREMLELD